MVRLAVGCVYCLICCLCGLFACVELRLFVLVVVLHRFWVLGFYVWGLGVCYAYGCCGFGLGLCYFAAIDSILVVCFDVVCFLQCVFGFGFGCFVCVLRVFVLIVLLWYDCLPRSCHCCLSL